MRMKFVTALLCLCLLLGGCSQWMGGSYASVEPYLDQSYQGDLGIVTVSSYHQLRAALAEMVENAVESRTFSVGEMEQKNLDTNIQMAIRNVLYSHPIGAYAVENIRYEKGTTGGANAIVFTVEYNHNRGEILRMKQVDSMDAATSLITGAMDSLEDGIVMQVSNYRYADYAQLVKDYSLLHPEEVMELPQVSVNIYPDSGMVRVVELKFVYQTSRETLKEMQNYVQPKFSAASLYVSGDKEAGAKFARLYAFLMETGSYTVETSITPAYSLLRHYVGDSKAFATVYAAMCRKAGLDCQTISGTKEGEPWYWNIICEDGVYYHVDLLRSYGEGGYRKLADGDMSGYVWDYTAYPQCGPEEEPDGGEDTTAEQLPEDTQGADQTQETMEAPNETTETTQETTAEAETTEATEGGAE